MVERLIKSMKDECTRRIIVSYNQREFAEELDLYFAWYNEYRPHEWLDGRTPMWKRIERLIVAVIERNRRNRWGWIWRFWKADGTCL